MCLQCVSTTGAQWRREIVDEKNGNELIHKLMNDPSADPKQHSFGLWRLWGLQGCLGWSIYFKWHHSRTECKSSLFLLLLLCVFEGTTHQVPPMATFGDRGRGARVAAPTKGPLPTPPGPYKLKLFRE